jgi:hypothetical protein
MRTTTLALTLISAAGILTPAKAQTWTQASPATSPSARQYQAMAYDAARGQVVLFGGLSGIRLNDTWVWDGANWTQKSPSTSPSARVGHAMVYDSAHGQVVLFGGIGNSGPLSDTWVWDGSNWTQKSPSTSPSARDYHAMAYDSAHGQVVLFGGYDGSNALGETWVWDGTNWSLKAPGTSPRARYAHAMAYDSAHAQVVLFGGINTNVLGDTWVWDGTNWSQKAIPANPPFIPDPSPRDLFAMAYDSAHGQVILFGGFDGTNTLGDTWAWDGTNWNPESPGIVPFVPSARADLAMAYDVAHAQVVLFGGGKPASPASNLSDTWLWSFSVFSNWAQKSPSNEPPARDGHAMAYDSSHGQTILFGGNNLNSGTPLAGDTWAWDGANWIQKVVGAPSPRSGHAMAYDSAHGQVVLFSGGAGPGVYFLDTWVWDGSSWIPKSPATSPPGRTNFAMAYDAAHGQVVLFGGYNGTLLSDTWVWDGTNWTLKTPATSPPARWYHAMAYDASHGQVVLFGGIDASNAFLSDTWAWDGSNWTQKSPSTVPSPRSGHSMAYDSAGAEVLLFGGQNGNFIHLGDTWVWDGTNWTQKSYSTNPAPRTQSAMTYDAAHKQVVLFGGFYDTNGLLTLSDTWVWDAIAVSPNAGSGTGPQVFTAAYFDNNGASDLQVVYLDFGSLADAAHDCKAAYAQAANTLFLFNDADNGVVGSIILGGGGSLSNSQCTLFGGSTAATSLGTSLTVPFTIQFLAGYGGKKTIWGVAQSYSGIQSANGVFEALGTWTPVASTPGVVSVNPSSGIGSAQVFTAVYSDTGGANDLQAVYLDFGSVGFAAHNCIVVYVPGPNQLYLFTDDNSSAVGPIAEGAGGGSIGNSQCTLSSGNTPATLSGANLTVRFNITFKSGYGGKKTIFGLAQNYAGVQSNGGVLTSLGTWEPSTTTPAAVSVNPNSGSGFGQQTFSAVYSDTGGVNDLQVVYLSFGNSFMAAHSCNVGYEPGNNTLLLFSDDNSTAATLGAGSPGSVSNSECALSSNSGAISSGTSLTVPFTITFHGTFLTKTIFGLAQTYDGTQSPVTTLGMWTPTP